MVLTFSKILLNLTKLLNCMWYIHGDCTNTLPLPNLSNTVAGMVDFRDMNWTSSMDRDIRIDGLVVFKNIKNLINSRRVI